ncbi:tetratricopeptide repeat protein [Chitinophaga qingshengii]|uniref:Tetratricopeptide repeat protein n=1 Tax=Chitinophaga qingshengii TaxID=1569794 RepID=A0ABR7TRT3_9BACT|nr:tetratricopeptide repeat protein [Chitinophaga qingshengii]MBC9933202.1 tetratricopeptide repeat protein [Chitinophaga qingshengii]
MKYIFCSLPVLFFFATEIQAQSTFFTPQQRDSIHKHYLDAATRYHYFAPEWGQALDSGLALLPQDATMWQLRGMPLFKQRKYEAGMVYLDKAVAYNPAEYLDYRAFIKCIFQKSYVAAIADFKEAQRARYHSGVMDHPYNFYLGLCYLQLNQYDSARAYFRQCVDNWQQSGTEAPLHCLYPFYLGIVDYEQGKYTEALNHFTHSLLLYQQFSDAGYYQALCLQRLQRTAEAKAAMQKAHDDFKQGYTIPEDNQIYEMYPYQVSAFMYPREDKK